MRKHGMCMYIVVKNNTQSKKALKRMEKEKKQNYRI